MWACRIILKLDVISENMQVAFGILYEKVRKYTISLQPLTPTKAN